MADVGPAAGDEGAVPYGLDDDLVASARSGLAGFRSYVPDGVSVVLGRGSRPEVELDGEACAADGVPILRRPGGGCAVVLDPGNVIVAAAIPQEGLPRIRELFASFTEWLLGGLRRVGVGGVFREDVSDLVLGDRKVGGASLYRPRGAVLYVVSLLVDPRPELMERYLRHPPREPAYRRGRRHADFVGRLADSGGWTATTLAAALRRALPVPGSGGEGKVATDEHG